MKEFITYGKGGIIKKHKSKLVATIRARLNQDFVDVPYKDGVRSIKDFRDSNKRLKDKIRKLVRLK